MARTSNLLQVFFVFQAAFCRSRVWFLASPSSVVQHSCLLFTMLTILPTIPGNASIAGLCLTTVHNSGKLFIILSSKAPIIPAPGFHHYYYKPAKVAARNL